MALHSGCIRLVAGGNAGTARLENVAAGDCHGSLTRRTGELMSLNKRRLRICVGIQCGVRSRRFGSMPSSELPMPGLTNRDSRQAVRKSRLAERVGLHTREAFFVSDSGIPRPRRVPGDVRQQVCPSLSPPSRTKSTIKKFPPLFLAQSWSHAARDQRYSLPYRSYFEKWQSPAGALQAFPGQGVLTQDTS